MNITVKLFAFFRNGRFKEKIFEYPESAVVADVINKLGINADEVGVTMINSRLCKLNTPLQEGDILAIFPVIGGG